MIGACLVAWMCVRKRTTPLASSVPPKRHNPDHAALYTRKTHRELERDSVAAARHVPQLLHHTVPVAGRQSGKERQDDFLCCENRQQRFRVSRRKKEKEKRSWRNEDSVASPAHGGVTLGNAHHTTPQQHPTAQHHTCHTPRSHESRVTHMVVA